MSTTPIVPGFHPDPSVCRVGDDYWLVTSSFEYRPGVPILHSRDLVAWDLVGNVLDRDDQLPPSSSAGSRGVFAPTIRNHDGRFWVITTDFDEIHRGHLIVSATDPAGPWSTPVRTAGVVGIDPDLFWDEDGTCWMTWAGFGPTGSAILQAPIDPASGALLAEPRRTWAGSGLAFPEGPHVHRRGDWYYLLLAEGGTERGHAVTVARSRALAGPWEPCPANPVLSRRSTAHPVQSTGHADLVETADGGWAMVHLGVRPIGPTPGFHVNGRETFLVGIDWIDDWPVVVEDAFDVPDLPRDVVDDFSEPVLHPRWIAPGAHPASFTSPAAGGGVAVVDGVAGRALLGTRVEQRSWEARAEVDVGRLVLRMDDAHWVAVERDGAAVTARAVIGPIDHVLGTGAADGAAVLTIRSTPETRRDGPIVTVDETLTFGFRVGDEFRAVAAMDGRYISTEVAGGFTGRVVGVEPLPGGTTVLRRFELRDLGGPAAG